MTITHRQVNAGRLSLHVAELGAGEPVLLLHGFPAYWRDWERTMHALAARGFRAIAIDLPGYGDSGRLPRLLDYRATLLVEDLAKLLEALALPSVHLVGHDWGGTLAYCLASQQPRLVRKLIIVNGPHPELLRRALRHFEQLRRSWYFFFFQLPWLPEWLLRRSRVVPGVLRAMQAHADAFSEAELAQYLEAIRRPGVARAAVNYYRAAFREPVRARPPVVRETLVLWGDQDQALSADLLLADLDKYVPGVRTERFPNGGHWLHHDLPEAFSGRLVAFLSGLP